MRYYFAARPVHPNLFAEVHLYMGDNWETPAHIFAELAERIALEPGTTLYDPFFSTGLARQGLQAAFPGLSIVHEPGLDFFSPESRAIHCDYIVTNPPFSNVRKCMVEAISRGVPVAMLVKGEIMFTGYMQAVFREYGPENFAVLLPPRRYAYVKPETGDLVKRVPFYSLWITYKMPIRSGLTTPVRVEMMGDEQMFS